MCMVSLAFLPSIPQEHLTSHTDRGLTETGWGKANVRGKVGAGCFENSHTEDPVGQSCLHQAVSGTGLTLVSRSSPQATGPHPVRTVRTSSLHAQLYSQPHSCSCRRGRPEPVPRVGCGSDSEATSRVPSGLADHPSPRSPPAGASLWHYSPGWCFHPGSRRLS